jgi:tripartite-type tricarboxylate transporter receptor subunit TctC
MLMIRMCRQIAWSALALVILAAAPACAEEYPSKPVKIIVSLAPGGLADMFARLFAQHVTEVTKQAVVVENRTGAAGVVGAEVAAKAPADGYTLYLGLHSTIAILQYLNPKLPYDPDKDFVPVVHIATLPNLLVVHPSVPARSVAQLIAYAKAKPGTLSYASQGNGSSGHMAGEQFNLLTGADIVHVPYRGAAPAMQDLIGGRVQLMFDTVTLQAPQIAAGKTRALAVTSTQRVAALADVPTTVEAGLPALQGGAWFGLFAPAGTPPEVVAWLNRAAREAFIAPAVYARLQQQGAQLPLGPPESFAAFIAAERQRWSEVIRKANIRLEQ